MKLTWDNIQANAVAFSKRWKNAHNEEAEAQSFTTDFLYVFGVDDPVKIGDFEYKVPLSGNKTGYVDYLWKGQIAIEMKSRGKNLTEAFEQLRNYMSHLPEGEIPDLWLVCDFENMRLCRRSTNELYNFKTNDLRKHIKKFANIAGYATERIRDDQIEVNVKAAEKMAKLHDELKEQGYEGHSLELYLVRLLFCLFADDTGIFPQDSFYRYLDNSKADGSDLTERISRLFEVLNMPPDVREKKKLLSDELKQFRYINGKLFADLLQYADFDAKMRQILLDCVNFDWNKISPAIFGAMFQGVMDKTQRRELGAHYTSEENILKLINPLFMDDLWKEFERVKATPAALDRFHEKIAKLKFLDPACGCGNFLIITYRELRLLELEILKMKNDTSQMIIDITPMVKVSVEQFYGIEYEDFPCQIAQVGMWLIDHQMNLRVSEYFGQYYARLPLTQSATIVHGNALKIEWADVIPRQELNYILGNPPFIGYSLQTKEQKEDITNVFGDKFKGAGKIDYVCAWYKKSADYMKYTNIKCAFVSTNSITQGEQVALLWKPLIERGIYINFGISTFKWNNEAKGKAAVFCVIVGFSYNKTEPNINPYLIEAPNIFIESRSRPLCDMPEMITGNRPADGGNLIIEDKDIADFIKNDSLSQKYIKRFMGSEEFINNKKRWCLWLVGVSPSELRQMPEVLKRINACKSDRENSPDEGRRKLANTPMLFREKNNPDTFIVIPKVSSERRNYIPIDFLSSATIASDLLFIIPNATLYHFGILTSSVHMVWTRAVCGRLKSDYRYSKDIVYNNFVWADTTEEQQTAIEKLAQGILDTRLLYPESSLADLYDPLTMPPELTKAHKALDTAVMKLYGFDNKATEADIVKGLMERYKKLVNK